MNDKPGAVTLSRQGADTKKKDQDSQKAKEVDVADPVPLEKDAVKTTKAAPSKVDDYDGFYGLSDMDAESRFKRWRSLLTMEDMMVAALMKRLMYEGEALTNVAAYHGLRDAMGHFISEIKMKDRKLAMQIDQKYCEKGDGSTDNKEMPPATNP